MCKTLQVLGLAQHKLLLVPAQLAANASHWRLLVAALDGVQVHLGHENIWGTYPLVI